MRIVISVPTPLCGEDVQYRSKGMRGYVKNGALKARCQAELR